MTYNTYKEALLALESRATVLRATLSGLVASTGGIPRGERELRVARTRSALGRVERAVTEFQADAENFNRFENDPEWQ